MSDEPLPQSELILYQTEDGRTRIQCRFENETIWLTQANMAELFQTTPQNVTLHLKSIFEDGELQEEATCKDYLQVRKGLLLSRPWLEPLTNAKSPSRRDAGKNEIYFVSQGVALL